MNNLRKWENVSICDKERPRCCLGLLSIRLLMIVLNPRGSYK
jgi:hypothetical protein